MWCGAKSRISSELFIRVTFIPSLSKLDMKSVALGPAAKENDRIIQSPNLV